MIRKLVQWIVDLLLLRHVVRLVAYFRRQRATSEESTESADAQEASADGDRQARRAKFWRRVRTSLLIGITIEIVLIIGHSLHFSILMAAEDTAMDFVMRQFRNREVGDEHTAFVLLEVDQATFQMWGEPFYFHRNRVQRMIEFASGYAPNGDPATQTERSADPALIIVDVDLAKAGRNDGSEDLKSYLRRYSRAANPPLILVRTLTNWPAAESGDAVARERPSFLDSVLSDEGNRNIFWASPHYQLDDDYRIRRWLLWLQTRVEERPSVLPSVQLLAQVLLNTEGDRPAVAKYRQLIDQLEQAASCDVPGWQPSKKQCADPVVRLGRDGAAYTIEQVGSLTSQRLIYTIPYEQREGVRGPKVDGRVPVFERESAMQMADIDRSFLADRVVVIGGTYRESRDWYATPIGEMPGAMVVINAVHSLGANGFLHPPPVWMKFAIVACLVLMMSLVFAWLDSFPALLAASAFVLMLLVPVSFLMFRYGVWVDFALPLLAVQLHEFTAEFESIEKKRKNRASEQVSKKQATPDHSSAGAETTSTTKDRAESA